MLTFADAGVVHRGLTQTAALNEQFEALIELSQDFIAIADLEGRVTFLNRAGRALVGLETDDEVLGRPTDDYFTDSGRRKSREIEEAVRVHGTWAGETSLRHFATGEEIPVSANSFLVTRTSDGTPLALATVQRDLRARIRQEEAALARAQEQRAIAELGRQALTASLGDLTNAAVELIHARYPALVAGVLQRSEDGLRSEMVASSLIEWLAGRARPRRQLAHRPRPGPQRAGLHRRRGRGPELPARRPPPPSTACARRCAARSRAESTPGASSARPAPSPGTGPRTTSRSWSRSRRRWAPPYAGRSWRPSCTTRPCTTR